MKRILSLVGCLFMMAAGMTTPAAAAAPQVSAPAATEPPALTRADLEPWLDGFFPYALQRGKIAGAVVVVVKNGEVLLAKGYGFSDVARRRPVDPATTLFRPGSVSKLFTWTAVMQLVEQGKLDLDADINRYLDFRIPPLNGKPVTLRNLMTHTGGFEEHVKSLIVSNRAYVMDLARWEKSETPRRIYAPGEVPAYSNYGASTAGYIVQRVSGEPFEQYVERHIFQPLGMAHATFRQPLPTALAGDMGQSYRLASGPPQPYEYVNGAPAGALAASGGDLARFMIAILNGGQGEAGRILKPETVRLMLSPAFIEAPPLNGMALGWFMDDRNGRAARGHGGDLSNQHSQLDILPGDQAGLFVSLNSSGEGTATTAIRDALYRGFMDRYFPAPTPAEPTLANAKADGAKIAGFYDISRKADNTPFAIQRLVQQVEVKVGPDGLVSLPFLDRLEGPKKWREVGPMIWREVGGKGRLAAVVRGGKVVAVTTDEIPQFAVLLPTPPVWRMSWRLPVFVIAFAVLAIAALSWPVTAWVRRAYGRRFDLKGRAALLHRAVRLEALLASAFIAVWFCLWAVFIAGNPLERANPAADPLLRGAQIVGVAGLVGLVFLIWNLIHVFASKERGWFTRASAVVILAAALFAYWTMAAIHAFSASLFY